MIVFFFNQPVSEQGRAALSERYRDRWARALPVTPDIMPGVVDMVCGVPYLGHWRALPATGDCDERGVCRCGCGLTPR